jgi:hypothetical protein
MIRKGKRKEISYTPHGMSRMHHLQSEGGMVCNQAVSYVPLHCEIDKETED